MKGWGSHGNGCGERKRVPPVDAEFGLEDAGRTTHVEDEDVVR